MNYRRLYDSMAPFYGASMRLLPVWRRYTRTALSWLPETGRILEIGPGPGLLLAEIARSDAAAFGLDLSMGMIRQARRQMQRMATPANLVQANAIHLPIADASLDAVVMTFAYSAIPDGLGTMCEVARVLRPSGLVILVDAGIPQDGNWAGSSMAKLWALFGDFMRDEAALMRAAGMAIIERREFGAFRGIRLTVGKRT